MPGQCKVKYQLQVFNGVDLHLSTRACPRAEFKDGLCLFHLDDPKKPLDPIQSELYRMIQGGEDVDCSMFVFPEGSLEIHSAISYPIYFENCKFYGNVDFTNCHFRQYASFFGSQFYGKVEFNSSPNIYRNLTTFEGRSLFNSAVFHDDASFRACVFREMPEFNGTIFKKVANFALVTFSFGTDRELLEFRLVDFLGPTDMHFRPSSHLGGIAFRHCDLSGLRIASIPRDLFRIEFEEIKNWKPLPKQILYRRIKIRDERQGGFPVELVDTYRYLERYFFDHSDFALASQFHVGVLVAQRKTPNYQRISRALSRLYQLTSNFGESLFRPLIATALMWIVVPALLLFLGMPVSRPSIENPVVANWDVSLDMSAQDIALFWNDYKSAFGSNIGQSTIDRRTEFSPPSDSFQKVILIGETAINVILLSFLVLAARRKFTPKKPTGT